MVFPDSRRWGERLYLLKSMRQCQRHSTRGVYGTGNITVNIFEKIQSTTTYYLKKKKKLISLLELENIYDAYNQPKV